MLQQFADAIDIERNEGVGLQEALGGVFAEEAGAVVAADAEGGLGQVVGAEGEELG